VPWLGVVPLDATMQTQLRASVSMCVRRDSDE
jgi:hypothetical protein